jgi:hypothetical protein
MEGLRALEDGFRDEPGRTLPDFLRRMREQRPARGTAG